MQLKWCLVCGFEPFPGKPESRLHGKLHSMRSNQKYGSQWGGCLVAQCLPFSGAGGSPACHHAPDPKRALNLSSSCAPRALQGSPGLGFPQHLRSIKYSSEAQSGLTYTTRSGAVMSPGALRATKGTGFSNISHALYGILSKVLR